MLLIKHPAIVFDTRLRLKTATATNFFPTPQSPSRRANNRHRQIYR
jgi:hypothetical protein